MEGSVCMKVVHQVSCVRTMRSSEAMLQAPACVSARLSAVPEGLVSVSVTVRQLRMKDLAVVGLRH